MQNSYIIQIGTANPETKLSQKAAAQHMADMLAFDPRKAKTLIRFYQKTGIEYRYTVFNDADKSIAVPYLSTAQRMQVYERHACNLALRAIEQGIAKAYLNKITHIITVSCTGMYAPGLDIELINHLGLPTHVQRSCINFMGCYGAFNALKLADHICIANPQAYVLIVSVEICTLHLQPLEQMDHFISNAVFADGAACALISAKAEGKKNLKLKSFFCDIEYNEKNAMTWSIRDQGFDIRLSSYVPKILQGGVLPLVSKLFANLALTLDDISHFAIHPGGKEILNSVEKALTIPKEKIQEAYEILRDYGNMSSATILFLLQKIMNNLTEKNHSNHILALAFGPGLTMESALLEISHT